MPSTAVHIGIILMVYATAGTFIECAPIAGTYREIEQRTHNMETTSPATGSQTSNDAAEPTRPRIFYSALGDILETLPFLPITINVPDLLSGAWSYVSGWLPWGGSATGTRRPVTTEASPTRQEILDYILY